MYKTLFTSKRQHFQISFFCSKPAALPSQCSWCPDVKHGQVHLLSDSRSPFSGHRLFLFCKIWLESKLQFHYMGFSCAILHCHWTLDTLSRLLTVIITWCSTTQLGSRSRSCLKVRQSSQSTVRSHEIDAIIAISPYPRAEDKLHTPRGLEILSSSEAVKVA